MGKIYAKSFNNSMGVGAPQSFQFFRQITWFLENNGALSKFLHEILYCLISITRFLKNLFLKPNFMLTTGAN